MKRDTWDAIFGGLILGGLIVIIALTTVILLDAIGSKALCP